MPIVGVARLLWGGCFWNNEASGGQIRKRELKGCLKPIRGGRFRAHEAFVGSVLGKAPPAMAHLGVPGCLLQSQGHQYPNLQYVQGPYIGKRNSRVE